MKKFFKLGLVVILLFIVITAEAEKNDYLTIPSLSKITKKEGVLSLKDKIAIYYSGVKRSSILDKTLGEDIFSAFIIDYSVKSEKEADIVLKEKNGILAEAYEIDITSDQISIYAGDATGFLYALQSLRQIIGKNTAKNLLINCVEIEDSPRVGFRSFMLDSGRQYHKVETIKKYLDMLVILKMNYFHWHLTEGLGWRVAIDKYPELAKKGSQVGGLPEQQGFYSRAEMEEIVRYAAARSITVIPEIDMPGHAEAAIFAYPDLGCFGKEPTIPKKGSTETIFCAGKDHTINFLKDVLDEVCDIFPSEYIHIGGDEAKKGNWDKCLNCLKRREVLGLENSHQLQLWFTAEMANHLGKKGRKAICWGDALTSTGYDLPDNVVVQWWRAKASGNSVAKEYITAMDKGLEVICGTNYYNYLNFPTVPWSLYKEGRTFDMEDIYMRNPSYYMPKTTPYDKVIGMSTSLWTDGNVTENMIDRRVFPRIFAVAEQMWYKEDLKDFNVFMGIVKDKQNWFEDLGYKYGPALKETTPADYKWD